MRYNVVRLKEYTGDIAEYLAEYTNRGHAIACLKGLERRAWESGSSARYAIRRG